MDRLRARYEQRGKAELYAALHPCLGGSRPPVSYAQIGVTLGLSEGNVKVMVHRLRQEFGQILRAEIAETVADESEVDEEIRQLMRVTGGP
jgi:RNA polymerase sigma-70 factor (ECF subfamily)